MRVAYEWPATVEALTATQHRLAEQAQAALEQDPFALSAGPLVGGCFVAFARGEAGPGHPGDRAWAAAVVWDPGGAAALRDSGAALRGMAGGGEPRRAADVVDQCVVSDAVPAAYSAGFLALREGPILEAAVNGLDVTPDVLLVDATGADHPRGAGLAIHLGSVLALPTVGVTHRALRAVGLEPGASRGSMTPAWQDDRVVAVWVCTRTGARPVLAHAGWRTDPQTAAAVVLACSTEAARTPVPLIEARRVAREARALASVG